MGGNYKIRLLCAILRFNEDIDWNYKLLQELSINGNITRLFYKLRCNKFDYNQQRK